MEKIRCTECDRRYWTTSPAGLAARGIECEACGGRLVPVSGEDDPSGPPPPDTRTG